MTVRRGIAVSPGVAIGPALVLGNKNFRIPQRFVSVDAVETEIARFRTALETVCVEIEQNQQLATEQLGKQYGAIFGAHLQLLRDKKLLGEIEGLVREKCFSPEFASSRVLRQYARVFENLGNPYLAERAADLFDLERRLLTELLGEPREELSHLTEPVIVLAHNLTPSETSKLDRNLVRGFATEVGGRTSHTAILAGALEIPAVVGIGSFLGDIDGGETVVVDGTHGEVMVDPDEAAIERYRVSEERIRVYVERLRSQPDVECRTADGERIRLFGNIEFPEEVDVCRQRGADGIGLYRTEFLYLEKESEPSEEDHFQAYRRVISAFPDSPVVIRTLDLGADKMPASFRTRTAEGTNPALGLRSIRLSLRNLALFRTQLRAILRAGVFGDVRIMFPLVSTLLELRQARMILSEVVEDLAEGNVEFAADVPVGIMVEVPSAALMAKEFAEEVDFFSIGTNDLIQYTLAADRADQEVAALYSSADPSILRLIRNVVDAAGPRQLPVTVCGQMSSDPKFVPLLVGLGLRQLSVAPQMVPELKEVLKNVTIPDAEAIARHALSLDVARDVESFLRGELKKTCPDLVV